MTALATVNLTVSNLQTGAPLPGASVTVYKTGTTTKASIWDLLGSPLSNPLVADSTGLVQFQIVAGTVCDVVWSAGSYTSPRYAVGVESASVATVLSSILAVSSSSSVAVGTGARVLSVPAGFPFFAGERLLVANSPSSWMQGTVTSYIGTVLVIDVDTVSGSGTYSSWTIGVAGQRGPQGLPGADGAAGAAGAPWSYVPALGGAAKVANAAALPSFVYASGVMTASVNGAFPSIDGVALSVGDRFVHWDYTGANGTNVAYGIYTLTDAGSAGTKWTATRAADADTAVELGLVSVFVVGGSVNAGLMLAVTNTAGSITLGTTPICVTIASGNAAVGAEAALRAAGDTALQNAIVDLPELVMTAGSSTTVQKFVEAAGVITAPSCYQSISWTSGQTYNVQVLVRAAERKSINLFCNTGAVFDNTFLLDLGLVSGSGASVKALGNSFYLCTVTVVAASTASGNFQIRIGNGLGYTGDGSSGVYLVSAKILLSGANQTVSPSDFSTAFWTKVNGTITSGVSLSQATAGATVEALGQAVLGTLTGDKFVEASGASVSPSVYQYMGGWTNGVVYTMTVDAKAGERSRMRLFSNFGAIFDCIFDLRHGTATGTGAAISSLSNGWYRCTVTVTATATATSNFQILILPDSGSAPYVGNGTSGIYVNSAYVRDGSGKIISTDATSFSESNWSKQNVTVVSDQAIFCGIPNSLSSPISPLAGLEHVGLGTSLTAQGHYTSAMIADIGTNFTNAGISGASLGAASNGHYGSLLIYNAIASISTTARIVTLECCTNDFAAALVPLGSRGDSTTATFYGALRAAIDAIIARAPNANIFFISDHGAGSGSAANSAFATNGNGNTLRQFWQAMEDVCADMGVWFIDAGRKAGVGYSNASVLTSDGLHFNAAGGSVFGGYCSQEILRAYAANYIR